MNIKYMMWLNVLLLNCNLLSQSTYIWIGSNGSGGNGTWNTASHWSPTRSSANSSDILLFGSGSSSTVTINNGFTSGSIRVNNNSSVTLSATATRNLMVSNVSGDDLAIAPGSNLVVGNNVNLTMAANSSANIDGSLRIGSGRNFTSGGSGTIINLSGTLTNDGTYDASTTNTITNVSGIFINGGNISNATAARLIFLNGGAYQHDQDGGALPTATWNTNSTCLISGINSTLPTGLAQTFGNFTWNCSGQSTDIALGLVFNFNIAGSFTLNSTGSGILQLPLLLPTNISGDYVQSGGTLSFAPFLLKTVNVGGNFSMTGGTLIMTNNATSTTMNVSGNFSQTGGTITETGSGSGTIVFNGTNNQNITGGGAISNSINFNLNNSAGLTLLTSFTLPATLLMTQGNISTGENILTLGISTTNLGNLNRTSGTIVGNFRRWFTTGIVSNVLFPIGTSTNYRPANLSFTSPITTGGTLTAFFTPADPGTAGLPITDGAISIVNAGYEGYWTITSENGFNGGVYSLDLTADGFSGVTNVLTLQMLKRINGGNWTLQGTNSPGTGTTSTPVIHRTGLTGFGEYGVGGASDNPLPVELTSFTAKVLKSGGVQLNWRTETEVSNYGFEIERSQNPKSEIQNTQFEKIGFVEGNGNSNSPKDYSFEDNSAGYGKYAYRLKQIDTDGQFEYSKIVEVDAGNIPDGFVLEQNYPNPFNPSTTIKFAVAETQVAKLIIYDVLGNEVAIPFNGIAEGDKLYETEFRGENLSSGIYFYRLETENKVENRKMLLLK